MEPTFSEKEQIYEVQYLHRILYYGFPSKIGVAMLCISLDIHHLRALQQIVIPCSPQLPSS